MAVLFIAEIEEDHLSLASEACLAKIALFQASRPKEERVIDLVVLNKNWQALQCPKTLIEHCQTLLVPQSSLKSSVLAEDVAPFIAHLAPHYSMVIAPHTHRFSPIMLRVAASLQQNPILDVSHILDKNRFEYARYNGLFLTSVETKGMMQILTLNGGGYQPVKNAEMVALGKHNFTAVEQVAIADHPPLLRCTSADQPVPQSHSLQNAKIVIGCGGGVEDEAQFENVLQLAADLKAAVGGSKVFIDRGFLSPQELIGQSGKEIAPTLYLALGISGSMHHLSALKDSKIIIAVNNDAEASIIALSDYSLIDDIEHIMPKLMQAFA